LRWVTVAENNLNNNCQECEGCIWIDGSFTIYFTKLDLDRSCINKDHLIGLRYNNYNERLKLEDSIEFTDEEWKELEYKGQSFIVSSKGRIQTKYGKTFGTPGEEYLDFDGFRMHRLIANAFLQNELTKKMLETGKTESELIPNHKNNRGYDNRVSNLEWLTISENSNQAISDSNLSHDEKLDDSNNTKTDILEQPEAVRDTRAIKVSQYDKEGLVISAYPSITQARKKTGIAENIIRRNVNKNKDLNSGTFIYSGEYAWKEIIEEKSVSCLDVQEQFISDELNKYMVDGIIRIPKTDFEIMKKDPNKSIKLIMSLQDRIQEPPLPISKATKIQFSSLEKDQSAILEDTEHTLSIIANNIGGLFVNHFMYKSMIHGKPFKRVSYFDAWNDRVIREKLVRRALKYDNGFCNGTLYGCYGCEYGRLYNFPANVARCLYNHFGSRRILDFCAGYGGRLMGFWASQAEEYVGIDPNTANPYGELMEALRHIQPKTCSIVNQCAEDVDYEALGKFDMIFTSPPYFDTEIYSNDESQSTIRYPTFNDWFNKFLCTSLFKVKHALTDGGYLAINIKDHKKYKIVEPMLQYMRTLGLEELCPIKILQAKRYKVNTNYESIYMFRKARSISKIPTRFRPVKSCLV
jgi:tRNA1(Val) A37 N6-methylase TrmN6